MTDNNEYLREQGLDKLIVEKKSYFGNRISAKYNDLIRIHKLILKMKPKDILEFGVGWSTIVMLDAIKKLGGTSKLYSIDASKEWIKKTEKSKIVRVSALQTLTNFIITDPSLKPILLPQIKVQLKNSTGALASRGRKLLKLLKDSGL